MKAIEVVRDMNPMVDSELASHSRLEARFEMNGFDCEVRQCEWERPAHWRSRMDHHVLWMSLTPAPTQNRIELEALPGHFLRTGTVNLVPALSTMVARSDGGPQRLLICRIPSGHLEEQMGHRVIYSRQRMVSGLDLRDHDIHGTLLRLARELITPGFASRQMLEMLSGALVLDVGRFMCGESEGSKEGALATWQLRRIRERLDAGPAPNLSELASLCGISVRHLGRAFKLTTGDTVHHHIERKQVVRAKELLAETDLPLKVVAMQLGFHHAASFSVAFRRGAQESPSNYRARMRGKYSGSSDAVLNS